MDKKWLKYLRCPECRWEKLDFIRLGKSSLDKSAGIVLCLSCRRWYLESNGVLELVSEKINWKEKRQFFDVHSKSFKRIGITEEPGRYPENGGVRQKRKQAKFFDLFFEKERKDYQESPFWKAEYALSLAPFKKLIKKESLLVDAGCGEGACSFLLYKKGVTVIGFDISRHSVSQGNKMAREKGISDDVFFFVGDAEQPPLKSGVADHYVLFAVLHHVTDPAVTLKEASRVLKSGGNFFAHDNHDSKLRWLFDLLMRLSPLWHEEATDEPLFSGERIQGLVKPTPLVVETKSVVFLPPHFFNLFSASVAAKLLDLSNKFFCALPGLKNLGGIILIKGTNEGDQKDQRKNK